MLAFQYMMKKIVMPAHFLRESGEKNKYCIWTIFWFSTTIGGYTLQLIMLISCRN
jgi:hypothetical protein